VLKRDLRNQLLQQRQAIPSAEWQAKSKAICQHLSQSEIYQNAEGILAYLSTRQEPNLCELWTANATPKRWGFSRCVGKGLMWHQCSPFAPEHFEVGAYGLLEPIALRPVVNPEEVDLILVPAVACSRQGFRIGYGGGFYDRLFGHPQWAHKPTIGIVFEFAYLDELPRDPWDCPVQAVCTEQGLYQGESIPKR
jgi:5-formyltetrahydrofolate cyclo-ligase